MVKRSSRKKMLHILFIKVLRDRDKNGNILYRYIANFDM